MNIIIVAKPFSTPKVLRLGDWRSLALIGTAVAGVLVAAMGFGVVMGAAIAGPNQLKNELKQAQAELAGQHSELLRVRDSVDRDMDALALRLGRLQAQSTRLNALGERLAKAGKLDDGEFDFTQEPAMGGPESPVSVASLSATEVTSALDRLEGQLSRQTEQLGLLEAVLLDRELDQSLQPAGIPVKAGYIASTYGYRADPITGRMAFHSGVDFDGPKGSEILAVASGVVSYSGPRPGYGNVVEVDHGNGYMTRYAHNDRNVAQVGDPIRAGQTIARMGRTGRATGNHVHFEVWLNGRVVDPAGYIRAIR